MQKQPFYQHWLRWLTNVLHCAIPARGVVPPPIVDNQQLVAALEPVIVEVERRIGADEPELVRVFRQCYRNTLATTTELLPDGTTFVFTGDIPAMWLRDSSAQVMPYVPLAATNEAIRRVIVGLIHRQAMYILHDPYANAFNKAPNGRGHQRDRTTMSPWVWERKFALDSLCYPVQLCKDYWDATGDASVFDATLCQMFTRIVEVMRVEQRHHRDSPYTFRRCTLNRRDTLAHGGRSGPVSDTGMVWSGFRPSDDACQYGFHIPANMFAVVALGHVVEFAQRIFHDPALAVAAAQLRQRIDAGIQMYGIIEHAQHGTIYAYETDGLGQYVLMDDANVPSLLSIPYLGYRPADDPVYQRTRAFVLSRANPCYAEGRYAQGVGSRHTPRGYVWPLGLITQGLTTSDPAEQKRILTMLVSTTAGTGYMHESFDPANPECFTRPWFAWANSLFATLVCRRAEIVAT